MTKATVTAAGTIRRMSPRQADKLPPRVRAELKRAREERDKAVAKAETEFRKVVIEALPQGSVRDVADAAGISPTTVIAWSKDR